MRLLLLLLFVVIRTKHTHIFTPSSPPLARIVIAIFYVSQFCQYSLALALYPSLECRRRRGGRKTPPPSPPFRIRFLSHFFRSFFDQTRVFPIALLYFSFRRGHEQQRVQRFCKNRRRRTTTTRRPRGVHFVAWKRRLLVTNNVFSPTPPTNKAILIIIRRRRHARDDDDDDDQKECVFVEKKKQKECTQKSFHTTKTTKKKKIEPLPHSGHTTTTKNASFCNPKLKTRTQKKKKKKISPLRRLRSSRPQESKMLSLAQRRSRV